MEIEIKKIAKRLGITGSDLLTRPEGRRLYAKVKPLIEKVHTEEVVVIDFATFKVVDPSCVDEFLVRIIRDSMNPAKPFFLRLRNITPAIDQNIASVFDSYSEFAGMRIGVVTEDLMSMRGYYIGKMSEKERELLAYLHVSKHASVNDLAEHLHADLPGVEKTLEDLYAIRLVRRDFSPQRKGYTCV